MNITLFSKLNSFILSSGGTDIFVAMKSGYKTDCLISLAKIPDLDYLEYDPAEGLRVGAKVTISQILSSADVKTHYT